MSSATESVRNEYLEQVVRQKDQLEYGATAPPEGANVAYARDRITVLLQRGAPALYVAFTVARS